LELGLKLVTSAAATNLLSLLGGCRICDITLLFEASIPFADFENQQQDKATDTGPNKPVGVRPTEQTVSVRDIRVRPSFGAFNQVVPAGPPRHDYLSLVTGNKAVMNEIGDSDKGTRPRFRHTTVVCAASEWRISRRGGWLKRLLTFA
jgi:hypothetical protein